MGLDCAQCGQNLSVDVSAAGQVAECPSCGNPVIVPQNPPSTPDAPSDSLYCTQCGERNLENNFKCTRCGFVLHRPSQPQYVVPDDSTMGGLIPYKNAQALWAYYLGIFSLIPCAGIPLGVAALILGIRGLNYADLHPEAQGKGHAWTGIVLGGLCAVGYTLLMIAIPISLDAFD